VGENHSRLASHPDPVPSESESGRGYPEAGLEGKASQKLPASTQAAPHPGTEETTPRGPKLITEPEDRPRGGGSRAPAPGPSLLSRFLAPCSTQNQTGAAATTGRAETRGSHGRRPSPSPLRNPNTNNSSANPLPGSAPPTPQPRNPLLPARRPRRRPQRSELSSSDPDSLARSPEPGRAAGARERQPRRRPVAVLVPFPGHSPSARALGGRRARVGGPEPRCFDPDWSPCSEPMEPQRLCLPGLSPARTLEKHFRGSGGGKDFGTGTARGLKLPGPPGWGGAERSLSGPGSRISRAPR
jgi:hypothetical protein